MRTQQEAGATSTQNIKKNTINFGKVKKQSMLTPNISSG